VGGLAWIELDARGYRAAVRAGKATAAE